MTDEEALQILKKQEWLKPPSIPRDVSIAAAVAMNSLEFKIKVERLLNYIETDEDLTKSTM